MSDEDDEFMDALIKAMTEPIDPDWKPNPDESWHPWGGIAMPGRRTGKTYVQEQWIKAKRVSGEHVHVSRPEGVECINGDCDV